MSGLLPPLLVLRSHASSWHFILEALYLSYGDRPYSLRTCQLQYGQSDDARQACDMLW